MLCVRRSVFSFQTPFLHVFPPIHVHHLTRRCSERGPLLELRRVLRPDGLLLLTFHVGDDTIHLDHWWDQAVCVDFFFSGQLRWPPI